MSHQYWTGTSLPYLVPQTDGDVWAREASAAGRLGTHDIVFAGEVAPPADVADLLDLSDGGTAVLRRRLISLDDRPVEVADSYYPSAIARGTGLAEPRKIRGGAVALLAELGHTARLVREDVTARRADAEERTLFALGDGDPVLVMTRLVRDRDGGPIQVDVMTAPADSRRLRYEIKVGE